MFVDYLFIVSIFISSLPTIECTIQCYKCLFTNPVYVSNKVVPLCKDFDYSEKYVVDCPFSTYCMKKIFSGDVSGKINGTERDCAPQKLQNQKYQNGKWQEEIKIEEPYTEGCQVSDRKGQILNKIEYCYCNSYLCNQSYKKSPCIYVISSVIALFLYLR
ncbi:unnamed protein product [Brassicogethes aeneus]|uniref:Protein quiver n=1 Tax=Brassicogethes aeneus TaxID=1431903 RepID=A0A9P0AUN9_BRAAE|nr:unnamed protein product [Brassicogethes aeneus]